MGHFGVGPSSVPVLRSGFDVHDIALAYLQLLLLCSDDSSTFRNHQHLVISMRVPPGPSTGCKRYFIHPELIVDVEFLRKYGALEKVRFVRLSVTSHALDTHKTVPFVAKV